MEPGTKSPCVAICEMDARNEYCVGCGRSLMEIARWGMMTSDERRAVNHRLVTERTTPDHSQSVLLPQGDSGP